MQDINIYHLLSFYAKKWPWILSLTILSAAAGFVYNTYIQVPLYKSDATLLIVSSEDRKVGQDSTLINNYIQLIKSRRVLEPVIAEQGHSISYDELAGSTTAANDKNTEVIRISIASKDPETSKKLVDGVITSFKDEIKELYNRNNISVVDNASTSIQPYNVRTWTLVPAAALGGLLLSLIILFFAYDMSLVKKPSAKKQTKATAVVTPKTKVVSKPGKSVAVKTATKSAKEASVSSKVKPVPKKHATKTTKTAAKPAAPKRKK